MSPIGKLFVLGLFAASLSGLVLQIRSGIRDIRQVARTTGVSRQVKAIVIALCWMVLFIVRNVLGWRGALTLLIAASVVFMVLLLLLRFVYRPAAEGLISDLDSEEWQEWAVEFLLIGMAFAWFAFLLFAPFGVLCAIGLRACGGH